MRARALLLGAAIALGLPAAAQDGLIERTLEKQLSTEDRIVQIDGFDGALSSEATIERMTISDRDGVWLALEDVVIDWNRSALLRGRVEVETLSAGLIEIPRAPLAAESAAPSAEAQPFRLPELPVSVSIGEVAAERVVIGAPLFGLAAELTVAGSLRLGGGEGEGRIEARRLDGPGGTFRIAADYANETGILAVEALVEEPAGGVLATAIGLPGAPSVSLEAGGEGPLSDFEATLALATDGEERVTGTLTLEGGSEAGRAFAADLRGDLAPLVAPGFRDFFGNDVALAVTGTRAPDGTLTIPELRLAAAQLSLDGAVTIGADGLPDLVDVTGRIADDAGARVLLPLPGAPTSVAGLDLRLAFDAAEGESWTAALDIAGLSRPGLAADRLALTGTGTIAAGDTRQVTADLDLVAEALDLGNPEAQEALGQTVRAAATVDWRDGQPVAIDGLRVDGETYALTGSATVTGSADGPRLGLDIAAEARDLAVFAGLAGRPELSGRADAAIRGTAAPLSGLFDLTLTGTGDDLAVGIAEVDTLLGGAASFDIAAERDVSGTRLRSLTVETAGVAARGAANLDNARIAATLDATLTRTEVIAPGVAGPVAIRLRATGPREDIAVELAADGPGLALFTAVELAPAETNEAAWRVAGTASLDVAELAPFSPRLGREVSGRLAAEAKGSLVTDLSAFDLEIASTSRDLALGIPQVDRLLAGEATLDAAATREGDAIRIPRLKLASAPLDIDGSGRVRLDADYTTLLGGEADLTAVLRDTGLVLPGLPGPLTAEISASGAAAAWTVDGTVAAPGLALNADARIDLTGPAPLVEGLFGIDAADLAPFAELAGRPLAGAVAGTVSGRLAADLSEIDVTLDVTARDLETGIAQADALLAGTSTVRGAVTRAADRVAVTGLDLASPALSVAGDADLTLPQGATLPTAGSADLTGTLRTPAIVFPGLPGPLDFALKTTGTGTAWDVDATIDGPGTTAAADLALDLSGPVPVASGTVSADISDLAPFAAVAGRPLGGAVALRAEGRAATDLSAFEVSATGETRALRIGQPDADALLAGTTTLALAAGKEGAAIRIDRLELRNPQLAVTASGQTEAGSGSGAIAFDARLADISRWAGAVSGPATLEGTARRTAGGWQLDVDGTGPGGIRASVDGDISPAFDRFGLDLTGSLPLEIANPFIGPQALEGTAQFDLRLDGPPALQSVSGTVSTEDARAIAPTLGISMRGLDTTIRLTGGRAVIDARGQLEEGGTVAVAGPVTLSGGFPADLTVTLDGAGFRDPTLYQTEADGTITLRGPLAGGATIAGRIDLGETNLLIPASPVGGANPIPDLRHVATPRPVYRTLERAGQAGEGARSGAGDEGPGYALDLTINAPNRIFLRGRGLEAELGGSIRLTGTTKAVIPAGRFELIRGRLDILGQRLVLDEGFAQLQGNFDPYVNLVAATESDGTLLRIVVRGLASEPDILFLSEPDLPEDEVLARLLFGRGIDEISPLQAAQLAASVATLAGRGGEGIIGRLRQDFGLDDLDLTTSEDGGVGVRAGKYLSENVYTDVTVDSEGGADVSINLDLTPSVTVRGSVDSTGNSGLGVFFERDY